MTTISCGLAGDDALQPGTYDIVITTPNGTATASGAFVVLPNPAPILAETGVMTVYPPGGVLVASPGALVVIDYDSILLNTLHDAIISVTVGGALFGGAIPYIPSAPPTIGSNWTFYATIYNSQYNTTLIAPVPWLVLEYVPLPVLGTLCPGIALAFTDTLVVVEGTAFSPDIICVFGGARVNATWVSSKIVHCVVAPTNASAGEVSITLSNDFGATFADPPLYVDVLGSCATLKPNSVPLNGQCACPPGFEDASFACLPCALGSYQPHYAQQLCIPCGATQTTRSVGSVFGSACICDDSYYVHGTAGHIQQQKTCVLCPAGLVCVNETVGVLPGYWRASSIWPGIVVAVKCVASGGSCRGGNSSSEGDALCAPGYEGPICDVCSAGYGHLGAGCVHCQGSGRDAAGAFFLCVAICVALYYLIKITTTRVIYDGAAGAAGGLGGAARPPLETDGSIATVVKILFSYLQILYYVGNLSVSWSTQSLVFFSVFVPVTLSPSFSVFECAARLGFYSKMAIVMATPGLVVVGLSVGVAVIAFLPCKKWVLRHFVLSWESFARCVLVILYVLHPMIAQQVLTSLKCVSVPGLPGEFVQRDLSVSCSNVTYVSYKVGASIYIVAYIIGFPAAVARGMFRCRAELVNMLKQRDADDKAHKFLYFARGFRDRTFWWEGAILARKLLIVAISLVGDVELQLAWSGVVIFSAFAATASLSPYRTLTDNRLEMIALAALGASIVLGMHAVVLGEGANSTVFALLVIVNCGAIVLMIAASFERIRRAAAAVKEHPWTVALRRASSRLGMRIGLVPEEEEEKTEIKMYQMKPKRNTDVLDENYVPPPPPPLESPVTLASNSK
jgi:hypothetical protein